MSGDLVIQLYGQVHDARADHNTAVALDDRTNQNRAIARLRDLKSTADFVFQEPAPTPRKRPPAYRRPALPHTPPPA